LKGNKRHTGFLLLGGNIGNTKAYFDQCVQLLNATDVAVIKASSVYRSEPWGMDDAPWFLNQVLEVSTERLPEDLLALLLEVEQQLGRVREPNAGTTYTSRSIDIDLLYFDDLILDTKSLTIPHPRLHLRRFTLMPLVEIAPSWEHPVFKVDQQALLARCEDEGITERDA
jgi:2-amino-4-hydroxy-6-hydroxymethyldihydropteridine diphosphokinase